MRPLILRRIAPAECLPERDDLTDTDPLPATVTVRANGTSDAPETRLTAVAQETFDDN